MSVQLLPVPGVPLIEPGVDLAGVLVAAARAAGIELQDGDIAVVTGKIVSKAEGRIVDLRTIEPSGRAERLAARTEKDPRLVELVLRESVEVIRARPGNLLVRHRLGYVSAVAGIDRSNVSGSDDDAILLPADPDASAAALRRRIDEVAGVDVGVVITDSHGRPFRIGNTGVAIGVAAVAAARHLEGEPDLFGRPLTSASIVPVADLLASAAMLVTGEAGEGIPLVVVRGLRAPADGGESASSLIRPADRDMFAVPDDDYS
jgi:coenzyme F420-0:L-glutamate ligase/coenzyme F420-1:gamma-L-glutamate ligase